MTWLWDEIQVPEKSQKWTSSLLECFPTHWIGCFVLKDVIDHTLRPKRVHRTAVGPLSLPSCSLSSVQIVPTVTQIGHECCFERKELQYERLVRYGAARRVHRSIDNVGIFHYPLWKKVASVTLPKYGPVFVWLAISAWISNCWLCATLVTSVTVGASNIISQDGDRMVVMSLMANQISGKIIC